MANVSWLKCLFSEGMAQANFSLSQMQKTICILCSSRRPADRQIKQHFKSNRDLRRGERNTTALVTLAKCHLPILTMAFYNLFALNKDQNRRWFHHHFTKSSPVLYCIYTERVIKNPTVSKQAECNSCWNSLWPWQFSYRRHHLRSSCWRLMFFHLVH